MSPKLQKIALSRVAFFINILENSIPQFHAEYQQNKVASLFFITKHATKKIENTTIRKISTRNNAVKVYESISGHTDRNPVLVRACT